MHWTIKVAVVVLLAYLGANLCTYLSLTYGF